MKDATGSVFDNTTNIDPAKFKHDLMAPICNIKAYTGEVRFVATDIEELLLQHKGEIPESVELALRNLANVDIDICAKALDRAAASLEDQLQVVFNASSIEQ